MGWPCKHSTKIVNSTKVNQKTMKNINIAKLHYDGIKSLIGDWWKIMNEYELINAI